MWKAAWQILRPILETFIEAWTAEEGGDGVPEAGPGWAVLQCTEAQRQSAVDYLGKTWELIGLLAAGVLAAFDERVRGKPRKPVRPRTASDSQRKALDTLDKMNSSLMHSSIE